MKELTERLWKLWILWTLLHLITNTCTSTTAPALFYCCTPGIHPASSKVCLPCRPATFTDDLHNMRGRLHLLCDLDTSSHVAFPLDLVGQTSYIPDLTESRYHLWCTSLSLKTSSLLEVKVKCCLFSSRSPSVGRIGFPNHYKTDFSRIYKHILDTLLRTETNSIPDKWKLIMDSLQSLTRLYMSNDKEIKDSDEDYRNSVSSPRNVENRYKLFNYNSFHSQKHLSRRVESTELPQLESSMYKPAMDADMESVHNNDGRDHDRYTNEEQSNKDRKYYTIHHYYFSDIVSTQKLEKLYEVPGRANSHWKNAIIGPSYDDIAKRIQRSHLENGWQSLIMREDLHKRKTNNAIHDNNVGHENNNYEREIRSLFNVYKQLRDTRSNNYHYQSNEKGLNLPKEVNMDDDKLLAQRTFTKGGSIHNIDIHNNYNTNSNNAGVDAHVIPNKSSNKGSNNSNRRRLMLQAIISMYHKRKNNRKLNMTDRPDDRPNYKPKYQADYDSLLPSTGKRIESTDDKWSSSEFMAKPVRNSPSALSTSEAFHGEVTSVEDNLQQMEAELSHLEQNLPATASFQPLGDSSEISDGEFAESSGVSSADDISHAIDAMLSHNEEDSQPIVDPPDKQRLTESNHGYNVVKGKELNDKGQHLKPDLEPEGQSQGQHEMEQGIRFGDKADLVDPSLIPAWVIAMAVLCIVLIVVSLIMFFYDDK